MGGTLLHTLIWNNSLEQWLLALAWAGGAWLAGKLLYWVSSSVLRKLAARTETRLDDILIMALRGPVVVLVTVIGFYLAYHQLDIPERLDRWADRIFKVASVLTLTWLVARMLDALVEEYLIPKANREETTVIKSQLVPVVRSATKVLVWSMGIVLALNNAGYNVGALLAGIGIGGLAMAMAAKDTVANIFGGITVFADKPFQTGDRVRVAGYDGVVQEVGIRSTRIRTLDGPIVVVPNFKFTDSVLENVTNEPARRIRHELGLVYQTKPEKMEEALALLHRLVDDHQDVLEQERIVCFHAFKDFSLSILFAYHVRKGADLMHTQSVVHLELMRRFHAAGLEFAYPTAVELQGEYKK